MDRIGTLYAMFRYLGVNPCAEYSLRAYDVSARVKKFPRGALTHFPGRGKGKGEREGHIASHTGLIQAATLGWVCRIL